MASDLALTVTVPGDGRHEAELRHQVRQWLRERGSADERCMDIVLAVHEAAANSAEHGYRDAAIAGPVTVTLALEPDHVVVTVADQGSWRSPPERVDGRGYGLPLIHALADSVQLHQGHGGTMITATFGRH